MKRASLLIVVVGMLAGMLAGCASGVDFVTSMLGLNIGNPSCSDVPRFKRDMWGLTDRRGILIPPCTEYYATPGRTGPSDSLSGR